MIEGEFWKIDCFIILEIKGLENYYFGIQPTNIRYARSIFEPNLPISLNPRQKGYSMPINLGFAGNLSNSLADSIVMRFLY